MLLLFCSSTSAGLGSSYTERSRRPNQLSPHSFRFTLLTAGWHRDEHWDVGPLDLLTPGDKEIQRSRKREMMTLSTSITYGKMHTKSCCH